MRIRTIASPLGVVAASLAAVFRVAGTSGAAPGSTPIAPVAAKTCGPILGRAPSGGLSVVSPGNTAICLTESSPTCAGGAPKSLYPKAHNYARVVPNDAYQGAGLATFAKGVRVRSVFVLFADGDPTSLGQAKTFAGAAEKLGIEIAGFKPWNPKAKSYTASCARRSATPSNCTRPMPARRLP